MARPVGPDHLVVLIVGVLVVDGLSLDVGGGVVHLVPKQPVGGVPRGALTSGLPAA